MQDINRILDALDPSAPLAQRHIWLIGVLDWVRGDGRSVPAAVSRVQFLVEALEARPELLPRLRAWWRTMVLTVDFSVLLGDHGFAPRTAFFSELSERLRRKLLPGTPETVDASALFSLAFPHRLDGAWLAALDEPLLRRLAVQLSDPDDPRKPPWQNIVLDAITYCAGQIQANGFAPELRLRMGEKARADRAFHQLVGDVDQLARAVRQTASQEAVDAAAQQLRERLESCRQAVGDVYAHLDENGISVGVVFRLRQLRERILRVRDLLDMLLGGRPLASGARLIARMAQAEQDKRSVRALVRANSSLLAAKVAERSAETGEHYITRDAASYLRMLRKAAGGGVLTSVTVLLKFSIVALGLPAFWGGFWSGLAYAASFVLIQLLHCTLATKQPAMTAPAMAARLKDLSGDAVVCFVDEITHLTRSQVAAVLGNVLLVVPAVLGLSLLMQRALGHPMIDAAGAHYVLHALDLRGPTALYAAFTGVLLFAASIVAGWVENWFVLHRLDSALRYNPRITRVLGVQRAARWAGFMRENVSGFASNISLGLMLGLVPAFAAFFGLALDVRHVTLSAGQLAAAVAALGWEVLRQPAFWWCAAAIPAIGALNLAVSFYLAFRVAARAHNVSGVDRARIYAAIRSRLRRRPLQFFLPLRSATAAAHDDATRRPGNDAGIAELVER
ncbi:site-specific recombinase [Pseudorhodoferax sp.]|uniref:site-specific recombinase n=1 Tax=Pseudorhodoferax sp. TaxID=1993553 RepID=UPI0039E58D8B